MITLCELERELRRFDKKYHDAEIKDYLGSLDLQADHEENEDKAELMRDVYNLLLKLFPHCNPYTK